MTQPAWLSIVGIGEDGLGGLVPAARAAVMAAEVIVGGARHHALTAAASAERLAWPQPFDAMTARIAALRGRRVVVLVSGDPTWFSAGLAILAAFPADEVTVWPHVSAFQLAAARMGWPLAEVACLSVHGRPVEAILPALSPGVRALLLTGGPEAPAAVARLLVARGYGPSQMTVLAALGGPEEQRLDATAEGWSATAPALHVLALQVVAGPGARILPATPGLPDAAFAHDGTMTKAEVRAITLARLMPLRGELLWDLGAGCGSVGVEWMRAAPGARAIGVEPRADRRALAARNALALGTPGLELVAGEVPAALDGLPAPDAVFFGGGIGAEGIARAVAALRPRGRIVANAVTVESEAVLFAAQARHGGALTRIAIQRAEPLGPGLGWRPLMPVTQWSLGP